MKFFKYLIFTCVAIGLATLAACGGGSSGSGETGTLSVAMVDATTDDYKAVYVTVARVDVHRGDEVNGGMDGSWKTVAEPYGTYNLLDLINGVRAELGEGELLAGHYTQLRLIIGDEPDAGTNLLSRAHPYANYIITAENEEIELDKIPSGAQTGLKIVGGFDVNANATTELILDFDAHRSIVRAGKDPNIKYLLKPTVKILETRIAAIVAGTVTDTVEATNGPNPLPKTSITAQTTGPATGDAKDEVTIATGTISNDDGEYSLFLAPGSYNLVAKQTGYVTACQSVDLLAGESATADFALEVLPTDAVTRTLSGTVTIPGDDAEQYAVIDIRQTIPCVIPTDPPATEDQLVVIATFTVANGGEYNIELPAGEYEVVASTYGSDTQVETADLTTDNVEVYFEL